MLIQNTKIKICLVSVHGTSRMQMPLFSETCKKLSVATNLGGKGRKKKEREERRVVNSASQKSSFPLFSQPPLQQLKEISQSQ